MNEEAKFHCGFVAIIGRPNVGKSTLLNRLLGQKISITSRKPQTTRHRILGIKTLKDSQIIYVDTPGLHSGRRAILNKYLNQIATSVIGEVDIIVFMIEAGSWKEDDRKIINMLGASRIPVLLVLNKIDKLQDKAELLPYMDKLKSEYEFAEIIPLSASKNNNVMTLEENIRRYLPEGEPLYPEDQITDRSERFLAAEFIREKLTRHLGQELPYALTVEIEKFSEEKDILHISAVIWVERKGQKAAVIGKQGARLKMIGKESRLDMEKLFGKKIFLELWVNIKEGWSTDERTMKSLVYGNEL